MRHGDATRVSQHRQAGRNGRCNGSAWMPCHAEVWRHLLLRILVLMLLLAPHVCCGAADSGGTSTASLTLTPGRVVMPDGTLQTVQSVVIQNGRIKTVRPTTKQVHAKTASRDDTVLCPGLIDVLSTIGTNGWTMETTPLIDPEVNALDAVDPFDPAFSSALRAGITTVMIAPPGRNLVAGSAASVRSFVVQGQLEVVRSDGPLIFAFGPGVWRSDRFPTSRGGVLAELQQIVRQAQRGEGNARVREAILGKRDAVFVCSDAASVDAVRNTLGRRESSFALAHTNDVIDLASDLKGRMRPVVVGPYRFDSPRRVLLGAVRLTESGVDVAFAGTTTPSAPVESLRITAALAVRYGMEPAAARRAMTLVPAKVAGIERRVGAIAVGKQADLVLFSNDPLRLDATVLEVYVKGVRVYAARNQDTLIGRHP